MYRACKLFVAAFLGVFLLGAGVTEVADVLIARANPPVGQFVETVAGRQQIVEAAPDVQSAAAEPPIVLLHGAGANLNDMRVLLARLRPHQRVIAIDRPGSGWSERREGAADATPRRQAAIVHEVLRERGIVRPILVAHSWSGALALAYAIDFPDDLSGLVLLAPAAYPLRHGPLSFADAPVPEWALTALAHTLLTPVGLLATDWFVGRVFAPKSPPPDYLGRASILLALRPAAIIADLQDLAALESIPPERTARYSRITVPAVVITGDSDRILPPRLEAFAIARQLPHARLIVLHGVGHMPHYAAPDRVVAAIEDLSNQISLTARNEPVQAGGAVLKPAPTTVRP